MRHEKDYYQKIGFKCGLEIHQRLLTSEKLFCSCSANKEGEKLPIKIERTLRAVVGELGEIDKATGFESMKGRRFIYNTYKDTSCLVEIDEEPPHEVNKEALEISYLIAATFNASLPDEIEVMRKEVVDGSDPSAFQRTMLIGYDGFLELNGRKINIPSIFLEEESSGIESSDSEVVIYNVNRLGIPLIEIDTDPEIKNPDEAKEVAMSIGTLLRLTGKVQRGIGTIRQDVNVSIKEGARIEIKGFQELEVMDEIIDNEIERQQKLIEISKKLKERKAEVGEAIDATEIFSKTGAKIIKSAIEKKGVVLAAKLSGFKGLIGMEINPDRRLGSEISDYAKIAGVGGIIHSDEDLKGYGISEEEINNLCNKLEIKENDAFIIIAGEKEKAEKAISLARYRAEYAIKGVPPETRGIDSKKNITKFLRPLPGGARMYPETDEKPILVDHKLYEEIKKNVPSIERIESRLMNEIGNKQIVEELIRSPKLQDYFYIAEKVKDAYQLIATTLLQKMKELKRLGIDVERISNDTLICIFERYKNRIITKQAFEPIIKALPRNCSDVDRIIEEQKLVRISGDELIELIKNEIDKGNKQKNLIISSIMSKYRLNIDGEELNDVIDVLLKVDK
ncbi:MAG: Glu-tRNA(Gln) amidotransferase subunit GatE [Candidatus Micrarchaeota archaeon]